MNHVATVLCGTDLSDAADEALRQADAVARYYDARLIVVHVLPPVFPTHPLQPQLQDSEYARLPALERDTLAVLERRVADRIGRSSSAVELVVEHGVPYAVLVERAEAMGADLVVVGSRGATGVKRLLLGSVADRVMRYAHAPVLVVREGPATGQVLVGTDFSDPALPAVGAAVSEATRRSAKITIVHCVGLIGTLVPSMEGMRLVPTLSPEYRQNLYEATSERLREALAHFEAQGTPAVAEGDAAVAITQLAEELPAELVVVGTSGATGLRRMLLGSVAEATVRIAPCSVLVVRLGSPAPGDLMTAHRTKPSAA